MKNKLIDAALTALNNGELEVLYLVECSFGKYGPFISGKNKKSDAIATRLNKLFIQCPNFPGNLKELKGLLLKRKELRNAI